MDEKVWDRRLPKWDGDSKWSAQGHYMMMVSRWQGGDRWWQVCEEVEEEEMKRKGNEEKNKEWVL